MEKQIKKVLIITNFNIYDKAQEALTVAEKLATIDGVISTSTGFMLRKYKESGRIMQSEEEYERLKICL